MNFNVYCRSVIDRYPEYVTQKEMCAILDICKSTAYSLQKKGLILFGPSWAIPKDAEKPTDGKLREYIRKKN